MPAQGLDKKSKVVPVTTFVLPEVTKDKLTKKINVTDGEKITTFFELATPPPPKDLKKDVKDAVASALGLPPKPSKLVEVRPLAGRLLRAPWLHLPQGGWPDHAGRMCLPKPR